MEIDPKSESPIIEVLKRWLINSKRSQIANYRAANFFSSINYFIGVPAIILSALVGTMVFVGVGQEIDVSIQITIGLLSVLSAILGTLQTFLGLEQRASKHRLTASEYGSVKRELDLLIASKDISSKYPEEALDRIRLRMDTLAKESPELPGHIWKNALDTLPTARAAKLE